MNIKSIIIFSILVLYAGYITPATQPVDEQDVIVIDDEETIFICPEVQKIISTIAKLHMSTRSFSLFPVGVTLDEFIRQLIEKYGIRIA